MSRTLSSVDVQLLRAFKKHVLRPYRLLFNALNAAFADLTASLLEGKGTTTALSNDILRSYSLRDWADTLGLDDAARSMLSRCLDARIQKNELQLVATLKSLRQGICEMRAALEAFREGVWADASIMSCDAHQRCILGDTVMGERGSLTYRQVCRAVEEILCACEREVEEVKAIVVKDFRDACASYRDQRDPKFMEQAYWEVRVLTWVTDVYIEWDSLERDMAVMAADAGLPYFAKRRS